MSPSAQASRRRKHLLWGWAGLLVFLTLGLVLEALHGLKSQLYVGVDVETRRTMWRLAHAHGGLIALVHLAFASVVDELPLRSASMGSRALVLAICAMPSGFWLGGIWFHAGDPGLGVLLVPVGGLALLIGVAATLRGLMLSRDPSDV